jgi:hypothetical protein
MVVSSKTRWLIIVTGCLMAAAGFALGLSLGFAFPALISVVGAMVQRKYFRLGRGLICAGAILLSFCVFGVGFLFLTEMNARSGVKIPDIVEVFSVALVAVCDAAIVREEIRIRRAERAARELTSVSA